MSNNKVLIHVGLPKTASTTLQRHVFCKRELGFVPFSGDGSYGGSSDAVHFFISVNDLAFDAAECRRHFDAAAREVEADDCVLVLSQERLIGNPDKGEYYGKSSAERLNEVFPEAHVLMVVREQCKYALSSYNQRIRSGSNMSLERFIGSKGCRRGYPPTLDPDFLEYDRLLRYYRSLFGSDQVKVMPFENLVGDLSGSILEIQRSLGLREVPIIGEVPRSNRGEGMATVRARRFLNTFAGEANAFGPNRHGFTWKGINALTKGINYIVPQSKQQKQREQYARLIDEHFKNRFCESNARLSELTGIDFKQLGYQ